MRLSKIMLLVVFLGLGSAFGFNVPNTPEHYFNDNTHTFTIEQCAAYDKKLENFERQSSVQFVVYVDNALPSDSVLEDYTYKCASTWKVGQVGKNNGVVLFWFKDNRKLRIEVGKGLEGGTQALLIPDAIAYRIINTEIVPQFKQQHWNAGIDAGIDSIMKAATGEYKGNGQTVADSNGAANVPSGKAGPVYLLLIWFLGLAWYWEVLIVIIVLTILYLLAQSGAFDGGGGYTSGGGWSSGGSSSSGGSFSGGGGSFGGGGASGGY